MNSLQIDKLDELFKLDSYSLNKEEKRALMAKLLKELCIHHYQNCLEYRSIIDSLNVDLNKIGALEDIPYIPVRLFKLFELLSVPRENIVKTLTSSGTSSQLKSKIFLDKDNTLTQSKTLNNIIQSFIGTTRLPLLILDTELVKKDRTMYSARGAGIIGFSLFGRNTVYALDENMDLDIDRVVEFFNKNQDETILMFGYTFMLWQYVVRVLEDRGIKFNLKNAILFHIGGWKKLKEQAVDTLEFNERVKKVFGNVTVHNYYGMAEQLGSVFVECEYGHMHCSNFSDVIIRRTKDFSVADSGESGLMQLVSVIQTSYPGHSVLTEDQGVILGEDNCPCGRKGKFFRILGRIKNAELRGCSDTFSTK